MGKYDGIAVCTELETQTFSYIFAIVFIRMHIKTAAAIGQCYES